MKKVLYLILILMIFILNSSSILANINAVNSQAGVVFSVKILKPEISGKFYSDNIVYFIVLNDVLSDNKVLFKKNSKGYAMTNVELHTTSYGKTGVLKIQEAKIKDVNGVSHRVQLNTIVQGKTKKVIGVVASGMDLLFNFTPLGSWMERHSAVVGPNRVIQAVLLD